MTFLSSTRGPRLSSESLCVTGKQTLHRRRVTATDWSPLQYCCRPAGRPALPTLLPCPSVDATLDATLVSMFLVFEYAPEKRYNR